MKVLRTVVVVTTASIAAAAYGQNPNWDRHFGPEDHAGLSYVHVGNRSQQESLAGISVREQEDGVISYSYHDSPNVQADPETLAGRYHGISMPTLVGAGQRARIPACTPVDAHMNPAKPLAPCLYHLDPDPYFIYEY